MPNIIRVLHKYILKLRRLHERVGTGVLRLVHDLHDPRRGLLHPLVRHVQHRPVRIFRVQRLCQTELLRHLSHRGVLHRALVLALHADGREPVGANVVKHLAVDQQPEHPLRVHVVYVLWNHELTVPRDQRQVRHLVPALSEVDAQRGLTRAGDAEDQDIGVSPPIRTRAVVHLPRELHRLDHAVIIRAQRLRRSVRVGGRAAFRDWHAHPGHHEMRLHGLEQRAPQVDRFNFVQLTRGHHRRDHLGRGQRVHHQSVVLSRLPHDLVRI